MVISFGRHRIGGQQAARPLRQRVLLAVVGSTIVLLGVLGITITQINLARLEREEGNTLLANARYFAELLDMTIGRQLMDLESRATLLPILALHQEPAKLATWLTTIQAKIPEYTWIGFANAKGQIVASGNQILRDHDVTRREWFQAGQQQARTLDLHDAQLLSAHMPVRIDGQPWRFIDLVAPVRHRNGTLLGVLGAHLIWDWLIAQHQRFSESLTRQRNTEIIVLGPDGDIRLLGPGLTGSDMTTLASVVAAQSGKSGWVRETWADGESYLVGFTRNPGYGHGHQLGWVTLARVPTRQAAPLWHSSIISVWLLIAVAMGIFLVAIHRLLTQTLRPIEMLIRMIRTVARNGGRVQPEPDTPHEFVMLSQATNQLIAAMEARQAADQAKSQFLADMSHEIRTPLHGLIGYAELLKNRLHTARDQDDIRQIILCARDLTEIVNDLLDLSAIEEHRLQFVHQPLQLQELVEFNVKLFEPLAHEKALVFSVRTEISNAPYIMGDRLRLGQILKNLLSNAIKFTERGRVDVRVCVTMIPIPSGSPSPTSEVAVTRAAPTPPESVSAMLTITVEDTGIGLSQTQQELIFGRFQQAAPDTRVRFGGSGLGLSVCRALVHAMGGRLALESALHQGTRICIDIPVAPALHMDNHRSSATPSLPISDSGTRLRILVVDDVATNRQLLTRWLDTRGHHVDDASTGAEALGRVASSTYDLILMDIDLPDLSGREITRTIRDSSYTSARSRIFAVSGHAFAHDITASMAAGFDGHFSKPLNFDELSQALSMITSVDGSGPIETPADHRKNPDTHWPHPIRVSPSPE